MKHYKRIAVVGKGPVGLSIVDQLSQLRNKHVISYDELRSYDSTTIMNAYNTQPELLIYAGVPGVKWKANDNPDFDKFCVSLAFNHIKSINALQTWLISTIDVLDTDSNNYYGQNRLNLEREVLENIKNSKVFRLPALKGKFVTKNFWFDCRYPRFTNVNDSLKLKLENVIDILDLDYKFVELTSSDYSIVRNYDQSEVSTREFGKAYSTNPYSIFLWLDLDNFVYKMFESDDSENRTYLLASSKFENDVISPAYYDAYHTYEMTTGRVMNKSIRSSYQDVLPKVNHLSMCKNVLVTLCDQVSFKD